MITPQQLYDATNGGLSILALHIPEIETYLRKDEAFRLRPGERTPSARVKLLKGVYRVTDFGDDQTCKTPIDIHMDATGYTFPQAIQDLAQIFDISDSLDAAINKPDIRKMPLSDIPEERKGEKCWWEFVPDEEISEKHCRIMGPLVKVAHLQALNWHLVKYIAHVKEDQGEVVMKHSNENFPIFMRECSYMKDGVKVFFYKVYEPLNPKKEYRFTYQPAGAKPGKDSGFINGYTELKQRFDEYNAAREKEWLADPANEGKPYKEEKLDEAVICSGERDALCVRSLGSFPLWFNSETYNITSKEMKSIERLVKRVYNIPDIDTTGIKKGREVALKYLNVHTIWLPESLKKWKDNRGRPRKDFRDWLELNYTKEGAFRKLKDAATPAKFWRESYQESGIKYYIKPTCLFEFIRLNGFALLHDKYNPGETMVKITGNLVEWIYPKMIRDFVREWAIEEGLPIDLRDEILKTKYLGDQTIRSILGEVELDFTRHTIDTQTFYFNRFGVKVSKDGFEKVDYLRGDNENYVWDDSIIKHDISLMPDMFEITHSGNGLRSEDYDIEIKDNRSNFFRYLINSSRIYWRKELEGDGSEDLTEYGKEHRFDIAGSRLSEAEIKEQKRCLINKIFIIGYMLHRYKAASKSWAPFIMDNVIGENGQCNGRSGKSFMFKALGNLINSWTLSGRKKTLLEDRFVFAGIDRKTDMVLVDDCDEYMPFKDFYDKISSDITIDKKSINPYNLKYEESPKFAFTTNYVPKDFDPSSVARWVFGVTSDYYHEQSETNDYLETRSIKHDFGGKDLFDAYYPESAWEADINFWLQCCRFYLSTLSKGVKIQPDISNIIFRKYLADMSDNFREWAEGYFSTWSEDSEKIDSQGGEHLDVELIREDVFDEYKKFSGVSKITMQRFTTSLKAFCITCDWIDCLNPVEMHNSKGRILKRITMPDGSKKQKEVIYLRSKINNKPAPVSRPQEKQSESVADLFKEWGVNT